MSKETALDTLTNLVTGLGGKADKRLAAMFVAASLMTNEELYALYQDSWVAGKIINAPVDDMLRQGWTVKHEGDDNVTKMLLQIDQDFQIPLKLAELLTWGRLYGGSAMLFVTSEKDMTGEFKQGSTATLENLVVLDRTQLSASPDIEREITNKNFGLPKAYTINESTSKVHASRMAILRGKVVPYEKMKTNDYFGMSFLQGMRESIRSYESAVATLEQFMQEAKVDVMSVKNLADYLATDQGTEAVKKRFQVANSLKSTLGLLIMDSEDTYTTKDMTFAGVADAVTRLADNLTGASGLPATKLFGRSPGGLNSTGDSDTLNYYDTLAMYQKNVLVPILTRIYRIALGKAYGPEKLLEVCFNPLWQESASVVAANEKIRAEYTRIYLEDNVITKEVAAAELLERGVYSKMTQEDVDLVGELENEIDTTGNEDLNTQDPNNNQQPPVNES